MGSLFFPLAALAKQLLSPTMHLFGRLASTKNRLAESNNLLFAHPLIVSEDFTSYVMNFELGVQIFLAVLFLVAGISHFRNPTFYLKITPLWVPFPNIVNTVVGIIEIILAIALMIPASKPYAAWGIIVLLVAVFPANVYHFQKSLKKGKHVMLTLIRLPLQAVLIYLTYLLT